MTLNKMMPWGRRELPIRREEEYRATPAFGEFDTSFRDLERLFDRFLGLPESSHGALTNGVFTPSLDVHETEKDFQIRLEIPGMDEKDIDISINRDVLTVSGEKKEEKEENVKGFYRVERRFGSFSRSVRLPENCVDTEKAEAAYKSGVLTVKLPKLTEYKQCTRKIPIGSETPVNGKECNPN